MKNLFCRLLGHKASAKLLTFVQDNDSLQVNSACSRCKLFFVLNEVALPTRPSDAKAMRDMAATIERLKKPDHGTKALSRQIEGLERKVASYKLQRVQDLTTIRSLRSDLHRKHKSTRG